MRAAAAAALAVLALVSAGCGSDTGRVVGADADKAHGKQLFTEKCAACHTLKEAKAVGTIGPNLDASFAPDRAQGFEESTFRQVVYDQIKYPGNYGENGPTMPENLVTGDDVEDVAAYVAYVAGSPKNSVTASHAPATTTPPESGGGGGAASAAGKKAFTDNGCSSCHTLAAAGATGKIGPDLDKLKTYAADADKPLEDFIHESIVAPNDYVEKGYPKGVMPSFASLPEKSLDALVAYLAASAK